MFWFLRRLKEFVIFASVIFDCDFQRGLVPQYSDGRDLVPTSGKETGSWERGLIQLVCR